MCLAVVEQLCFAVGDYGAVPLMLHGLRRSLAGLLREVAHTGDECPGGL